MTLASTTHDQKRFTFFTAWLPLFISYLFPVWAYINFSSYKQVFQNEFYGLAELVHAIFPLVTAIIVIGLIIRHRHEMHWIVLAYLIVMIVGCIYLAGEEVSWGQHHFGWETSEEWKRINSQNETNLHNNSVLLNLLPRAVLMIAIILGATALQWVWQNRREWVPQVFHVIYPPATLLMLALLIIFWEVIIQLGNNFDLSAFLPLHDGEVQEVFIVWAVLLYALKLRERFNEERPAAIVSE